MKKIVQSINTNLINSYWADICIAISFSVISTFVIYGLTKIIEIADRFSPKMFNPVFVVAIPGMAGIIVGIISYLAKIRPSGGITDVIETISVKRRVLGDPKLALKPFLTGISIFGGNPVGKDIMVGAQVSAILSYFTKLPHNRLRLHVACGACAGVAASFSAPLAAVAFTIEVILRQYNTYEFCMLTLSSISAYILAKILGVNLLLNIPKLGQIHFVDFIWFVLLGLSCFIVGFLWTNLTKIVERFTKKIPYIPIVGPTIAGFLFGLIALVIPGVWGPGYVVINNLFMSNLPLSMIILLIIGKVVGNSLVIGSGGSGGDLAPTVFLGSMTGMAMSSIIGGRYKPELMVAGICAHLASNMHAPFTGILLALEFSNQLTESLPLMITAAIAAFISIKFMPLSVFEKKAKDRGLSRYNTKAYNLRETKIKDSMHKNYLWVDSDDTVKKGIDLMRENHLQGIPVLKKGMLHGVLTLKDLREKVGTLDLTKKVELFCTEGVEVVTPDTSVGHAWKLMRESEIGWLMVTSKTHPGRLLGIVTKDDMLHAFARRSSRIHD